MAEYTANAIQEVAENQNVLFTDTVICGNNSIVHREGSGLITLRGLTCQCRARFKITFGGNIAIPEDGTATDPISIAIAINGEPVASSKAISTPGVVDEYNNVSSTIFLHVPAGCCAQISVENTSTQSINIQNANLIVERVA